MTLLLCHVSAGELDLKWSKWQTPVQSGQNDSFVSVNVFFGFGCGLTRELCAGWWVTGDMYSVHMYHDKFDVLWGTRMHTCKYLGILLLYTLHIISTFSPQQLSLWCDLSFSGAVYSMDLQGVSQSVKYLAINQSQSASHLVSESPSLCLFACLSVRHDIFRWETGHPLCITLNFVGMEIEMKATS